jgi:hypothetical protein
VLKVARGKDMADNEEDEDEDEDEEGVMVGRGAVED